MGLAAPTLAQVSAPEPVPVARTAGEGRLTWWGLPVYDAQLRVGAGFVATDFANHPFVLELRYLRALRGASIAERSIDEIRRAARISDAQAQRWQGLLTGIFPDVENGDRLTGIHTPGRGVRFLFNGKLQGEIAEPEFAALFFAIWLGPATSQPELRAALLGITR
jgi:hypothetical protein